MKKFLLFTVSLLTITLFSCSSSQSKFNPTISQVINDLEVHNANYDPLTFIRCAETGLNISVQSDEILIDQLGTYNVDFLITNPKTKDSITKSILISVVDKTAPEIIVTSEISIPVNQELDLSSFIRIEDNYDANLMNRLIIEGEYDIKKVGEYRVTLIVTDSSNNTARKTVTIYVENNHSNNNDDDIYGTYSINYTDEKKMNPQLVLSRDNTFRLTINYCAGMKTFTGIFTENESSIELVTDGFTFDDNDPSSSTISIIKNEDGSLTYASQYAACSPIKNDIFYKE